MTKFRIKLCTLLATLLVACIVCGACLFTSVRAENDSVDVNGWNTQVTRGGAAADGGHTLSDKGFTTYTDLQDGDVITYADVLHSPVVDGIVRTMPWRMDFNVVGEEGASITWEMTYADENAEGGRSTLYKSTAIVGGNAFNEVTGLSVSANRSFNSGENLSILFEGHHLYGANVYYVDETQSASTYSALGTIASVPNEGSLWYTVGAPKEFDLKVTVNGNVESVSVKVGEGMLFQYINTDWSWNGYGDGYAAANGAGAVYGVKQADNANSDVHLLDYFVFKGYEFKFYISQGSAESNKAYVTVGGTRVDSDGTAGTSVYLGLGYYTYTVPRSATSALFKVEKADDITVTYMNGEEKLAEAYLKSGDKAYDKDFAISGKRITGWYTDSALQNEFDFDTPVTADLTLYATTVDVLVVNFKDAEGNVLYFRNVDGGATVAAPANPSKAGMTFVGWFTTADGATEFDFTQAITANTDVYALFAYNVNLKVLGFNRNDGSQTYVIPVMAGGKLTSDMLPSFAEITGFPAYSNIELVWYTDATMIEKLNFGTDGVTIEGGVTYVAAVKDKDITVSEAYMTPNSDGWDLVGGSKKDADGNVLSANQTLAPNSTYGNSSQTAAMSSEGGYTTLGLHYVGYIANARKFDANEDIYLSYTLDSSIDIDPNDPTGTAHNAEKYFYVGMFNSLTGALINQGQLHESWAGAFAVFGHRVSTDMQSGAGEGKLETVKGLGGTSANNSFVYEEGKQVDLKISIGSDNTKIYQLKSGNWEEIATLWVTRAMFPDGMYLTLESTRLTKVNVRATQISKITKGAEANGTFTIDTAEALTGMLAGERVYFTATPDTGYQFTSKGVYAGNTAVDVKYDEENESYYFLMPFGENVITISYGVTVTFMADGADVNTPLLAVIGETLNPFDVLDPPAKTGHTFAGWYSDEALTEAFDFDNTVISAPLTLYAKYTPATYTITFIDGNTRYQTGTAVYGDKFTKPADPSKDGYTFVGWFTDAEGTTAYDFQTTVTGNVSVYAAWEENAVQSEGCGSAITVTVSAAAAFALLAVAAVALRKRAK